MPVYKDEKRKSWYVRVSASDPITGKRKEIKKRGFHTKREASDWEAEQIAAGRTSTSGITFRQLDELYIAYKNPAKESTRQQERTRVTKYMSAFADMPVNEITKPELMAWLLDLQNRDDCSVSTKNYCISVVRGVLRFGAELYGLENHSPILKKLRNGSKKPQMDVWTIEEFRTFLEAVPNGYYKSFFDFLYWTGCRRGEALAIRIGDVDMNKHTIRIWHAIKHFENGFETLKTDASERTIRIAPPLWKRLKPVLEVCTPERPFLFGGDRSLSLSMIQRVMNAAIAKSGVKRIRLHDLRHSFATNAINNGANIVAVSRYLGHSTIQQTLQTYTHLLDKTDEQMIGIVGSIDS